MEASAERGAQHRVQPECGCVRTKCKGLHHAGTGKRGDLAVPLLANFRWLQERRFAEIEDISPKLYDGSVMQRNVKAER